MRLAIKQKSISDEWVKWWAWYPVSVEAASGSSQWLWVWWETVERRKTIGYGGPTWRYREFLST